VGNLAAQLALLDVAAEFRYDSRLCRFSLGQLSFAQFRHLPSFVSGWAVFEESESIADAWQMSKASFASSKSARARPSYASRHG
jgi:hypothetical protein